MSDGSLRHICYSTLNHVSSSATAFGIKIVYALSQMSVQPLRTSSLDCWIRILQGVWGGRTCLITHSGQKRCRECPSQRSRSWIPSSGTTAWLPCPSTQQHPRHRSHLALSHRQDLLAHKSCGWHCSACSGLTCRGRLDPGILSTSQACAGGCRALTITCRACLPAARATCCA